MLARVLPGFHVRSIATAVLAACVLGFMNAIVRPILVILTFPVTLLTLGLFLLVLNAGMLALTAVLVEGFSVTEPASLAIASLALSLVGVVWKVISGDEKRRKSSEKKRR